MIKFRFILTILICCTFRVFAQLDSLQHYLSLAESDNPQLQAQHHRYLSMAERVQQVGVLPDPQLEVGVFVKSMETLMGKQYADIKLMQMFPWFGTLGAAKDEARYMVQMELDIWYSIRNELLFNVQKEYFALFALQQEINNTRQNIELLKRIEQSAIYQYETGKSSAAPASGGTQNQPLPSPTPPSNAMNDMSIQVNTSINTASKTAMPGMTSSGAMTTMSGSNATMSDILRIRIEMAEWDDMLHSLTDRMETQTARFNSLLSRPSQASVTLPDSLPPVALMIDEQVISDSIRQNHPMLQMYASESARNEASLTMNRRMGMPMIGLGIEYMPMGSSSMAMSDMNGRDMVMPMISLTIPIYRGKYKAQQREVNLAQQSTQANTQNAVNMLMVEMKEATQFYKEASRRARLYETQRTLVQQNLNLLLTQYSVGRNSIDDILRVEQQLLDYKTKSAKALSDMYTGKAWIEKLMTKN